MRILVSAFACSPLWGSEPSVGWNWARELARDHEVTILTHAFFRPHIEQHLAEHPVPGLHAEYIDLAPRRGAFGVDLLNSQLYYMRWQLRCRVRILQLLSREPFDLVHHVTWGNFRWPVPLHDLPVPVVVGPLGGGERAPWRLYRGLPWRVRAKELLRDLLIWSGRWDPWVRRGLRDARWVFCRTGHTARALPAAPRRRAVLAHDIGSSPAPGMVGEALSPSPAGSLRCLFVGRLLGWKGAHLALPALRLLCDRGVDARLTVVGRGELADHLREQSRQLGIADRIDWQPVLGRDEVMRLYREHDVFLFPSLHDSGGTVVLESLSCGCPVVCVDLGGPPHFVDETCGRVVHASDGDAAAVPVRLADALQALANDPATRRSLRDGALRRAREHAWSQRVSRAYAPIVQALVPAAAP